MRLPSDATLLVVDAGAAVRAPAAPGSPVDASACIRMLVEVWRSVGLPVVLADGEDDGAEAPADGVDTVRRPTASAFAGTDLDARLTLRGCTTLIICGVGVDESVEATARHAADLGFRLFVVADACTACDRSDLAGRAWAAADVHMLALGRMASVGARIVDWRTAWVAAKSSGWGRR